MPVYLRDKFDAQWQPSLDLIKGVPNGYARGDNLRWDEGGGVLTLRLGSTVLNPAITQGGAPRPLGSNQSSVHSMFTTTLATFRQRCMGVDDQVWVNFTQIATGFPGSGDIHFGSFKGQLMMARGPRSANNATTGNRKWDGVGAAERWGIPDPTAAPTLSAIDPDEKTFATFDQGETPAWVAREGSVAIDVGQDGAVNSALRATPTAQGKTTIEKVFTAEQDFNTYDGGDTGTDEDLIEFYVWVSNPDNLEYLILSIDVGAGGATTPRFQEDYYVQQFGLDQAVEMKLDPQSSLTDKYEVEGIRREVMRERLREGGARDFPTGARTRRDTPPTPGSGWNKFSVPRGTFERVGSTPGRDWSTVRAVQFTAKYRVEAGVQAGTLKYDNLKIRGGAHHPLTGRFTVKYVWVSNKANYIAKSGPSPISEEIELRSNALQVNIPGSASAAADPQVDEVWVYLAGGTLNRFYRFTTKNKATTGAISVTVESSERDAIIEDERLESDITEPPGDVIAIVGPHYERMLVFTATQMWASKRGNLDSYSVAESFDVADGSEILHWAADLLGEVIIGTSRDIYRLEGTGDELADGTIDFRFRPLNVPPAFSDFIAQEGNFLIYLASDGPRLFQGTGSEALSSNLSLLYQGEARYGIGAINLGSNPGRFRGGLLNGKLYVMVPEGASVGASNAVHVFDFGNRLWRRYLYPRSFQVVYREPDGKLLAGDSSGMAWQLETSNIGDVTNPHSNPTLSLPVPVQYLTFSDDGGLPLQYKVVFDFRVLCETGTAPAFLSMDFDEAPLAQISQAFVGQVSDEFRVDLSGVQDFRRVQLSIAGSFYTFKLRHWALTYRARPLPRVAWDTGFPDFGDEIKWLRELLVRLRVGTSVNFHIWVDGARVYSTTITTPVVAAFPTSDLVATAREVDVPINIPRNIHGRVIRFQLRSPTPFEPYFIRTVYSLSGAMTERRTVTLSVPSESVGA